MQPHAQPSPSNELRFALLRHDVEAIGGRPDHWDLMFEHGGALVTFELQRLPSAAGRLAARRLADHRLAYLEYEGAVSGNRGRVIRLDRGRYRELRAGIGDRWEQSFQYLITGQRLDAVLGCDRPLIELPLERSIELAVLQWDWHS